MKRGLKNILIIILILILTIGTFNCAKKIMIRNIFDEMYFGTKDVWGGHLTSTSWNNMSGLAKTIDCNGVQREHNKKLNNGLPILHKVPPKRDYGRYFCIMAEKGGTSHGGLTEKLSPFFHAKKQEVNAYGR